MIPVAPTPWEGETHEEDVHPGTMDRMAADLPDRLSSVRSRDSPLLWSAVGVLRALGGEGTALIASRAASLHGTAREAPRRWIQQSVEEYPGPYGPPEPLTQCSDLSP